MQSLDRRLLNAFRHAVTAGWETPGPALGSGHELFIRDSISGRRFPCDTGAQRSVLPASCLDMVTDGHGPPMEAANGSPIRTYGTRYIELCFGGHRFGWDFVTAKVSVPLLGADFLCAHGLLVDVKNRLLIDASRFVPMHARSAGLTPYDCLACSPP